MPPERVFETLRRVMLVDGLDLVLDLEASEGCRLVDARDGRRYLDCFSFFASNPVGMNHPRTRDPEFRERLLRASLSRPSNSDIYTVEMARFVETFRRLAMPEPFAHAFFVDGGALAVENALKASFDWKVRKNIARGLGESLGGQVLHLEQAFHGRSGYTLSLTNTADPRKTMYYPTFSWPRIESPHLRFPVDQAERRRVAGAEERALGQLERAFAERRDDIAAILVEPIQGEGGDNHFRPDFLRALREAADRHEALLVFDEVQTGVGMTGTFWAYQGLGVVPDMVCFAKKMQVGGFISGPRIDEVERNVFRESTRINSTWGGSLTDMVRAELILRIIEEEGLVQAAARLGRELLEGLEALAAAGAPIGNLRGTGLLCAFDLAGPEERDRVLKACWERGLLLLASGTRSIRFRPPLVISSEEIREGLGLLGEALEVLAATQVQPART
jgi:L-lysine 6-transaminase